MQDHLKKRQELIEEANRLVTEGQLKHHSDVSKLFAPEEIALICDYLIEIIPSPKRQNT